MLSSVGNILHTGASPKRALGVSLCLATWPCKHDPLHPSVVSFTNRRQAKYHVVASFNRELLVGDVVVLTSFSLYKQVAAIITSPSFEGWLAPLRLEPIRFAEWFGFASTLVLTWTAASVILGGYSSESVDVPRTLRSTSATWLACMPVAAAQLVISTAAESSALVGEEGWVRHLPLAASGPGEPFVTAAGVLGLMCIWRGYYCTHLSFWSEADAQQQQQFREAVFMVCVMAAMGTLVLGILRLTLTPSNIEQLTQLIP